MGISRDTEESDRIVGGSPLLAKARDTLRLKHYSIRTEVAYLGWIKGESCLTPLFLAVLLARMTYFFARLADILPAATGTPAPIFVVVLGSCSILDVRHSCPPAKEWVPDRRQIDAL